MPLFSRLFNDYIRAQTRQIVFAAICMVIAGVTTAANAWMMQPVLDQIFLAKDRTMLLILPLIVFAIALIKGGCGFTQMVIMKRVGQRVVSDMQLALYRHLLYADIALFGSQSSGTLISRFSNDIQLIRKHLTNVLMGVSKETVTLICLVAVMFYQSPMLALIAFTIFPVAVYPIIRLGKRMRRIAEDTQEELARYTATLDDTFYGIRIVKAYGAEALEANKAKTAIERIFQLYVKAARVESAASPIMEALAGIAVAAVIWYGGAQVLNGTTTPGAFFSFMAAFIMAYKPMKSLSGLNTNFQEAMAAVARIYAVLDTKPHIHDRENADKLNVPHGEITLDHVSFRYTEAQSTLDTIDLHVPAGKRVALVGPSGSGKSTILNLILRFYDPDAGSVTIDGQDIRHVTLASLRKHIALITQETTLFDDTIRANIAYGMPEASEDAIAEAAKAAAAHDFITELPEGYATQVGQRGLRLSGGQRQRIAIARAMLRNAPILLMDEATSALDPVSESQVQHALDQLMENRTTIVIAHRLSTVMHADIIYVLEHGRIVESGTHSELLARDGVYTSLYHRQFTATPEPAAAQE